MALVGRWLGIQSFKHDGTVHRTWDRGFVLENNENYIIVATKKAKVVESNGRRWHTKEPAVTIFSKKEWWNVICMIKTDGVCYYCNIASPSLIHQSYIKYIDYDLDVKLFPDNKIRLLDQKEYIHHKERYNYSVELDSVLKYQTEKIIELMKEKTFPFNSKKIIELYESFLEQTGKHEN